ncbi:MAG: hypothetical protein JWM88_2185 [Verrucomicrobia bacterium]|nr:hypothetical protein [Verrucomicrobiota bacterium]
MRQSRSGRFLQHFPLCTPRGAGYFARPMTRTTLYALAAVAVLGTAACERHSASELAGESTAPIHLPAEVPQNPAGAGPISPEDKHGAPGSQKHGDEKDAAPAALGATPAPKGSSFFPGNK